ncbi:MAG TPA: glycine zipper domain-containing protein [Chthoniobacterales bacterium]|nr:glycine zipper domain-containing protein [Chthoniobacterales bacterium]
MKKYFLPAVSAAILLATGLSSCETPAGQGAGFGAFSGAATGALIGAAASGTGEGAAIGAGAGALAGALLGAAVAEDQARYYHAPPDGYPYARPTATAGYVYSPYAPHNVIDVRGVPQGALVRDPSTNGIFRRP